MNIPGVYFSFENQGEEVTARQLWFSRPDFKLDQDDIDAIQALYGPPKVFDIQCSLYSNRFIVIITEIVSSSS